jgi:toxin ParE1/3/4
MKSVRFTVLAKSDLEEIYDFISRDNPKVATDYLSIIKRHCELLADNPKLGIKCEEYCDLYKFPIDNYLIFYRPSQSGIEVIRVLHSSRDIESIL